MQLVLPFAIEIELEELFEKLKTGMLFRPGQRRVLELLTIYKLQDEKRALYLRDKFLKACGELNG